MDNIRNFVVIAHIDHGKSTLADRFLEITGTVEKRLMKPQYLDQLELERERGITIKMAPVRMIYTMTNNHDNDRDKKSHSYSHLSSSDLKQKFVLNLIDTPGHSDFAYEVSRALAAVEGAVLLVDATQGIQAQTLANFENAKKVLRPGSGQVLRPGSGQAGLKIIGAVNKIDVATADQVEAVIQDLSNLLECSPEEILKVSGKTGAGIPELLETIIQKIPSPQPQTSNLKLQTSQALVFDSLYDEHKGVIAFVRVFSGTFEPNKNMYLAATKKEFKAKEVGYFAPQLKTTDKLRAGEMGFIATGIKNPDALRIGDTVIRVDPRFDPRKSANLALSGYQEPRPVVFVSFYPEDTNKYDELKQALSKLRLTDAALKFEADFSEVLGRGFKGGFLGRLHFEITAERLEREFSVSTVHSFPSVAYRVRMRERDTRLDQQKSVYEVVTNPKDFPNDAYVVEEPIARVEIVAPPQYLGAILQLKELFRFSEMETKTLNNKIVVSARLPLADLIRDLDDKLKSVSQGFASFHYELVGYERADVQKLEVMVAEHPVPGLTRILPKGDIEREARFTVEKLKELLPKQLFTQAIQAVAGGRIIARETIPALKKLLGSFGKTGGDRTRKMKLWKKQQKGKKKLKEMAAQNRIKIPASVFKELLKK